LWIRASLEKAVLYSAVRILVPFPFEREGGWFSGAGKIVLVEALGSVRTALAQVTPTRDVNIAGWAEQDEAKSEKRQAGNKLEVRVPSLPPAPG
jgi:hypothetical protein